jgi:SAM-dependent methyltransferase
MKLHLGCGTIFLKGYVNIDIDPKYLTNDAPPEILEQNITTIDKYYKHDFCSGSGVCVADKKATIDELPFDTGSCDEVVLIHVLEHVPSYKVSNVLNEINRVLKNMGTFILAVPDMKETARGLAEVDSPEKEDWYLRLIFGTQRGEWSHHYCGYIERTLKDLVFAHGFRGYERLPNINFYPALYIKTHKYGGC